MHLFSIIFSGNEKIRHFLKSNNDGIGSTCGIKQVNIHSPICLSFHLKIILASFLLTDL